MFDTHGPFILEGHRLDGLANVEVLSDASTVTTSTKTTEAGEIRTSNTSMITRGAVGGVVLGPLGAVIGANSASQNLSTESTSQTTQTRNVNTTVKLTFSDGGHLYVTLHEDSTLHWLLSMIGVEPADESQIARAELLAKAHVSVREKVGPKPSDEIGVKEVVSGVAGGALLAMLAWQWDIFIFFKIIVAFVALIFGSAIGGGLASLLGGHKNALDEYCAERLRLFRSAVPAIQTQEIVEGFFQRSSMNDRVS